MRILAILSWIGVLIGSMLGALSLMEAVALSTSAPQQAAGAAIACALVVIPYGAARAFDSFSK